MSEREPGNLQNLFPAFHLVETPIVVLDSEGRILFANTFLLDGCLLDEKALPGLFFWDSLLSEGQKPAFLEAWATWLTGQGANDLGVFSLIKGPGIHCPFSWSARMHVNQESERCVILTGKEVATAGSDDIMDKRFLEDELQRVRRGESLVSVATEFGNSFNNILTAILGNLSFAREIIETAPIEKVKDILEAAEMASLHAKDLTGKLLAFSGFCKPQKKVLSLLHHLEPVVKPLISGTSVLLDIDYEKDLWAIEADLEQMKKVFHHLALNAIQAMPAGGVLKIRISNQACTEKIHVSLKPGNYVCVVLTDQGIGIPPKDREKLFTPFFTTRSDAMGLGLSTIFLIVKNHGGNVFYEPEPAGGSTFSVYLPAFSEQVRATSDHRSKPLPSLLVVDDEDLIRSFVCELLQDRGFVASGAGDAAEACQILQQSLDKGDKFDFVLLDWNIPGSDGPEAILRSMRKIDERFGVILTSGFMDSDVYERAKKLGALGTLPKPFQIDELESLLQKLNQTKISDSTEMRK